MCLSPLLPKIDLEARPPPPLSGIEPLGAKVPMSTAYIEISEDPPTWLAGLEEEEY
jgi:hypothetical protein